MKLNTFKLEKYLAHHEFSAPYLLCCSDAESFSMQEIIAMASPDDRALWDNLRLNYTETKGLPALREQITQSFYPSLKSDNILCFAGAEEGIFCALSSILEPSDHVIVLTPCYQSLMEIPKAQGCEVTEVKLQEKNDWRINLNDIKQAIKANTKCVVINFPHNPTGQVINQDELDGLIKLLEPHNIWLFADEVYHSLGSPLQGWAKPVAKMYRYALSLGVMSKSFGLAGLRIGWIACQNKEILHKIEEIKHYTSICNSAPAEILSLIALKNKDQILARNNKIVADNLALLDAFFKKYAHLFSWVRPQGGCTGLVHYKDAMPINDFCEKVLKGCGVLLLPASVYSQDTPHFRIGFGRANMPESLKRFASHLDPC